MTQSLKPLRYFIAISLSLALLWEGYKLLAAPGGVYNKKDGRAKVEQPTLDFSAIMTAESALCKGIPEDV